VRSDLDAGAPNNPVALTRAGGHSIVGNSAALRIAGITPQTPQPAHGLIEHNDKGEPNGIVRENLDLYDEHIPTRTWDEVREDFLAKLKELLPFGITGIMEASG